MSEYLQQAKKFLAENEISLTIREANTTKLPRFGS